MVEPPRAVTPGQSQPDGPPLLAGIAESRTPTFTESFSATQAVRKGDSEKPKYVGEGTRDSPYIVDWDEDDPENPYNWKKKRKWPLTLLVSAS